MKALIAVFLLLPFLPAARAEHSHGIAMHGDLKHGADFSHFSYVNPKAPKGGELRLATFGSFDSLNPLIVKGVSATGIRGYVYESLLARAYDEPFSLYGLLAESVESPADRSSVTFYLDPRAKFSDGHPLTVEDVIFSHALLRDKGRPNHRFYYSKVEVVEKVGERGVKFIFKPEGDREMPLIMGLMPILPRHKISRENFEKTSFSPPIGSGPYQVADVEPGTRITYRRNKEYWGRDLAANRGRFNFDEIRFDYYRDDNTLFESFKKGLTRFRSEGEPSRWALGYHFPAVTDGRVLKKIFEIKTPAGMSALAFNTRRPLFSQSKTRQALTLLFDFEWTNKNLYHSLYARTESFFERSELSSHGRAADSHERTLLKDYPNAVQEEILEGRFNMPKSDGKGRNRENRRKAFKLLRESGFELKDGVLRDEKTGKAFTFEILIASRSQERLLLNFARHLKAMGITAHLRQVDSAQYQRRKQTYDFDMIQTTWRASLSPGNEQNFRWSAASADIPGTFNYPGIKNPAVDAMIKAVLSAKNRERFISSVRALDRVLLSGNYVIPLFHLPKQWVAHWRFLKHPEKPSLYGFQLDCWWREKEGGGLGLQ